MAPRHHEPLVTDDDFLDAEAEVDGPDLPEPADSEVRRADTHVDADSEAVVVVGEAESGGEEETAPDREVELPDIQLISLDDISHIENVRTDMRGIDRLAASIRVAGLKQPVTARRAGHGDGFELVFGYRRDAAFRLLREQAQEREKAGESLLESWSRIPAVVIVATDGEVTESQLTENIARESMNAVDEAHGMQRLIDAFGWTQKRVGEFFEVDRTQVTKRLGLLRQPQKVIDLVSAGKLSASHAEEIARLEEPGQQEELAELVARTEAPVSKVRQYANKIKEQQDAVAESVDPVVDQDVPMDIISEHDVTPMPRMALRDDIDSDDIARATLFVLLRQAHDLEIEEYLAERLGVAFADQWEWVANLDADQARLVSEAIVKRWLRSAARYPLLPAGLREDLGAGTDLVGRPELTDDLPDGLDFDDDDDVVF